MQFQMAHLRAQGINFAVFNANVRTDSDSDRADLLAQLTRAARAEGLRVDKSALAFMRHGRLTFYGTPDLVKYLSSGWRPHWTHTLTLD